MKEYFIASAVIHGVQGGAVVLTDDAFWFLCDKITIDDEYKRLKIPYGHIASVSYKRVAWIFPVAKLTLKNGRIHKFVIFSIKRFLRCMDKMLREERHHGSD